jgi:hypothetical protein
MAVAVNRLISGEANRVDVPLHLLMSVRELTILPFPYRKWLSWRAGA